MRHVPRTPAARLAGLAALAAVAASVPQARAADATSADCMAEAEKAQQLRRDGGLTGARQQLLLCGRAECPGFVQKDCARWLAEVDDAMPSIVVHAVTGAGVDVTDVRVRVDAAVVADRLDGRPILIDPGAHSIRYEHAGSDPLEERIVVVEGQKNRVLSVRFAGPPAPGEALAGPSAAAPSAAGASAAGASAAGPSLSSSAESREHVAEVRGGTPSLLLPWSLVGLGVVAAGTGAVLYGFALADHANMEGSCAPAHSCSTASVDGAKTRMYAGGAAIIVGTIAAGAGVWLLVGRSHDPSGETALGVGAAPGSASLDLRASF